MGFERLTVSVWRPSSLRLRATSFSDEQVVGANVGLDQQLDDATF
jgi:hypothetical protein